MARKTPPSQVSIRADTYDRLKAAADLMQQPISKIVDKLIHDFIDEEKRLNLPKFRGEF